MPRACPMSATPAAEPIDNSDPPTPAVSVTNNHCPRDISGSMLKTANMTGMLSYRWKSRTPHADFHAGVLRTAECDPIGTEKPEQQFPESRNFTA
jgi:hypothetical protein